MGVWWRRGPLSFLLPIILVNMLRRTRRKLVGSQDHSLGLERTLDKFASKSSAKIGHWRTSCISLCIAPQCYVWTYAVLSTCYVRLFPTLIMSLVERVPLRHLLRSRALPFVSLYSQCHKSGTSQSSQNTMARLLQSPCPSRATCTNMSTSASRLVAFRAVALPD